MRLADSDEERAELQKRCSEGKQRAESAGYKDVLDRFENAIQNESRAVINIWPSLLKSFLERDSSLYSTYSHQVEAEIRRPATFDHASRRGKVETTLFADIAPDIRYAALSLNDQGLVSYGSCTLIIKDLKLERSASLLEENSYDFVRRHQLVFLDDDVIPSGFRCRWSDRHKLAVAKLANSLNKTVQNSEFCGILLFTEGDRKTDRFIEVHIFGPFDYQGINNVHLPKLKDAKPAERSDLTVIRSRLKFLDIPCSSK